MRFHSQTVYTLTPSPLGPITLAASPAGLCGIWFEDQQHRPDMALWRTEPDHPVLKKVHTLLSGFFAYSDVKKLSQLHLPFDLQLGSSFQQSVWQALQKIPAGTTCSYAELAQAIGKPRAVRAVGSAIGRNPISILIPCHRVIGSRGNLTGYAGGLWRKEALLKLEASGSQKIVKQALFDQALAA